MTIKLHETLKALVPRIVQVDGEKHENAINPFPQVLTDLVTKEAQRWQLLAKLTPADQVRLVTSAGLTIINTIYQRDLPIASNWPYYILPFPRDVIIGFRKPNEEIDYVGRDQYTTEALELAKIIKSDEEYSQLPWSKLLHLLSMSTDTGVKRQVKQGIQILTDLKINGKRISEHQKRADLAEGIGSILAIIKYFTRSNKGSSQKLPEQFEIFLPSALPSEWADGRGLSASILLKIGRFPE